MILAAYQANDRGDPDGEKYSEFKKVLGVPEDKNLYWCFAANSTEQTFINSITTMANLPDVFILFETDDFIAVDKIKWLEIAINNYQVSEEDYRDALVLEHKGAVEYIVTEIPEERFELKLDMSNLEDCARISNMTNLQKSILYGFSLHSAEYLKSYTEDAKTLAELYENNLEEIKAPTAAVFASKMSKKVAFENNLLVSIYAVAKAVKTSVKEERSVLATNPGIDGMAEFYNDYALWNMGAILKSEETLYQELLGIYYNIYSVIFAQNPLDCLDIKLGPNELCLCGSGKKYKKCCKRVTREFNVIEIMSDTETSRKTDETTKRFMRFMGNLQKMSEG